MSDALPEDNWDGPTGFIHQAVYDNYLKDLASVLPDIREYTLTPNLAKPEPKRCMNILSKAELISSIFHLGQVVR